MRVKFSKGEQRKFIDLVLENTGCPSLRELINRGINVKYSSLKNYYIERRLLSGELFEELIGLAKLNRSDFDFGLFEDNFGQILGGKNSRKN